MVKNLESRASSYPSADLAFERINSDASYFVDTLDKISRANPALVEALGKISPKERKAFYEKLRQNIKYIPENNRGWKRALALENISEGAYKASNLEGSDEETMRGAIRHQIYGSPGRTYPYNNAILGAPRNVSAKNTIKDIYSTVKSFARYFLPTIGFSGAWWLADKLYDRENKRGVVEKVKGILPRKFYNYLPIPFVGNPLNILKDVTGGVAKEATRTGFSKTWGFARRPLLYLLGAYAIYKTAKYFLDKRKENKRAQEKDLQPLDDLRKQTALHQQILAHRAMGLPLNYEPSSG